MKPCSKLLRLLFTIHTLSISTASRSSIQPPARLWLSCFASRAPEARRGGAGGKEPLSRWSQRLPPWKNSAGSRSVPAHSTAQFEKTTRRSFALCSTIFATNQRKRLRVWSRCGQAAALWSDPADRHGSNPVWSLLSDLFRESAIMSKCKAYVATERVES